RTSSVPNSASAGTVGSHPVVSTTKVRTASHRKGVITGFRRRRRQVPSSPGARPASWRGRCQIDHRIAQPPGLNRGADRQLLSTGQDLGEPDRSAMYPQIVVAAGTDAVTRQGLVAELATQGASGKN